MSAFRDVYLPQSTHVSFTMAVTLHQLCCCREAERKLSEQHQPRGSTQRKMGSLGPC